MEFLFSQLSHLAPVTVCVLACMFEKKSGGTDQPVRMKLLIIDTGKEEHPEYFTNSTT